MRKSTKDICCRSMCYEATLDESGFEREGVSGLWKDAEHFCGFTEFADSHCGEPATHVVETHWTDYPTGKGYATRWGLCDHCYELYKKAKEETNFFAFEDMLLSASPRPPDTRSVLTDVFQDVEDL